MTLHGQAEWLHTGEVRNTGAYWSSRSKVRADTISAIFGPGASIWYSFLQRRIQFPGRPNAEILARVGLDQTVFAIPNVACFLTSQALMEGTSPAKKLETTYWKALSTNWMVWPFLQVITFKYIPLDQRVLFVNGVSIGMCFLCT